MLCKGKSLLKSQAKQNKPSTASLALDLLSPITTVTSQLSSGDRLWMVSVWSKPSETIWYLSDGLRGLPLMNHWTGSSSSLVLQVKVALQFSLPSVSVRWAVKSAGTAAQKKTKTLHATSTCELRVTQAVQLVPKLLAAKLKLAKTKSLHFQGSNICYLFLISGNRQ